MSRSEAGQVLKMLPGWVMADSLIEKKFRFGSYRDELEFAHREGEIAGTGASPRHG